MANQHVEIHDPFGGQNGISSSIISTKPPVSQRQNTEDMIEYRILMAYATRRRPNEAPESAQDNPSSTKDTAVNDPPTEERKRRKRKIWKRLPKVLACLKPQTKEEVCPDSDGGKEADGAAFRSGADESQKKDHLEDVAARLLEISDEIPFVRPDIETDSPDDVQVERLIGLLLREAGDRLNESELKGTDLTDLLGNYGFFERVILALLKRMGLFSDTETLGPKASTKTQIAVTCEATSRLSVLDTLPMNRLLGHGARFLKSHYSSWAQQHGGYENAFEDEDEDEVQ